jgi:hypothetical protein
VDRRSFTRLRSYQIFSFQFLERPLELRLIHTVPEKMSIAPSDITESAVLIGSQFNEPMRVIGTPAGGDGFIIVNLVGTCTNTFRGGVTLTKQDLAALQIEEQEKPFTGQPMLFKLGLEALRISLAQEYDPYFGLSISRVDRLPHQLDAVYNHLLKSARCRFLLADDAGAGKTIMAGLLIKELKLIVDEAHRMSARDADDKSERYRLGELLREKSAHFLLLTATPHKGDPANFCLFLQLLDQEAYADVKSIHDAMDNGEAACYLRRTKEVMLDFPKPQPDGTWKANKLFTKRIPGTVAFDLDGIEWDLYRAVTQYVQLQSARAAAAGDDRRARAVGFIMAMYQRRMASSTHSLKQSLLRREKALTQLLETAAQLGDLPMPEIPTTDEWEEMDDAERELKERELERATLSRRKPDLEAELKDIAKLIAKATLVEEGAHEIKLRRLKDQLTEKGFFADPSQRLLVFTEYKDTLDYLVSWRWPCCVVYTTHTAAIQTELQAPKIWTEPLNGVIFSACRPAKRRPHPLPSKANHYLR